MLNRLTKKPGGEEVYDNNTVTTISCQTASEQENSRKTITDMLGKMEVPPPPAQSAAAGPPTHTPSQGGAAAGPSLPLKKPSVPLMDFAARKVGPITTFWAPAKPGF